MSSTSKVNLKQLAQSRQKKIDSPLAKYNGSGQLFCVLCNAQVKNEIYWTGHVNGKAHKENLANLKSSKAAAAPPAANSLKRPAPPSSSSNDGFLAPAPPPPLKIQKLEEKKQQESISSGGSSSAAVRDAEEELKRMMGGGDMIRVGGGGDVKEEAGGENGGGGNDEENAKPSAGAPLPEGFFDDPKEDAKARGMKFRDKQDVEWDKFVKEIASEDVKSSEIVGVEQEKSAVERELDHIEEQMAQWQRVIELEKKAEEYAKQRKQETEDKRNRSATEPTSSTNSTSSMEVDEEDDDEEDADDYEEELDWRNKKR